jgi:DnaJ-domain-containing protein 1
MLFDRLKNIIKANMGDYIDKDFDEQQAKNIDAEYERLFGKKDPRNDHSDEFDYASNPFVDAKERNFYQVLGLPLNANFEQIREAYKKQIKIYHPDRWANKSPQEQQQASQKAQQINLAYTYFKKRFNA